MRRGTATAYESVLTLNPTRRLSLQFRLHKVEAIPRG
jgi:hypothetical protein